MFAYPVSMWITTLIKKEILWKKDPCSTLFPSILPVDLSFKLSDWIFCYETGLSKGVA